MVVGVVTHHVDRVLVDPPVVEAVVVAVVAVAVVGRTLSVVLVIVVPEMEGS